jgi:hypothetical protein
LGMPTSALAMAILHSDEVTGLVVPGADGDAVASSAIKIIASLTCVNNVITNSTSKADAINGVATEMPALKTNVFQMRVDEEFLRMLDAIRREYEGAIPSRAKVLRDLVAARFEADEKAAAKKKTRR